MTTDGSSAPQHMRVPRRVYLDTQFCFAYLAEGDPEHESADKYSLVLKQTCEADLVDCYISLLVIDELAWTIAGLTYDQQHGKGAWKKSHRHEAFCSVRSEVATIIDDFLSEPWIQTLGASAGACLAVPALMRNHPLSSADLCHLSVARDAGLAIVTNDGHFQSLSNSPVEIVSY